MELPWDTEVDTPATIAIIGAGPVGIEAALYGRFLGYSVEIYTSHRVGSRIAELRDIAMPTILREATSSLGLAALEAQGTPCRLAPDQVATYGEYLEQYLVPVAKTDLIYDSVHVQHRVKSIGRWMSGGLDLLDASESAKLQQRSELEFRLMVESQQRGGFAQLFDIVLDCSGLGAYRSGLAPGGSLAVGELQAAGIECGLSRIRRNKLSELSGKHTVLLGSELEAAVFVDAFSKMSQDSSGTRLTWLVPPATVRTGLQPPRGVAAGCELGRVFDRANAILRADELPILVQPAWGLESVSVQDSGAGASWSTKHLVAQLNADETLPINCDVFINCSTPLPDWRFADAVQATRLQHNAASDSSDPRAGSILTSEPHYYVLGSKAEPADYFMPLSEGLQQVRAAFALIGGRAGLDLYSTVGPQA